MTPYPPPNHDGLYSKPILIEKRVFFSLLGNLSGKNQVHTELKMRGMALPVNRILYYSTISLRIPLFLEFFTFESHILSISNVFEGSALNKLKNNPENRHLWRAALQLSQQINFTSCESK